MENYKKSTEHFTNALLASPLILGTGNISGAIVALMIGRLLDNLDNRNFLKKKQEYWENNPYLSSKITPEQMYNDTYKEIETRRLINQMEIIKNAKRIKTIYNTEGWITILGGEGWYITSRQLVRNGSVKFYDSTNRCIKQVPAKLYRNGKDFLTVLKSDAQKCENLMIYKIIGCNNGEWMYTIDDGETFVVGGF